MKIKYLHSTRKSRFKSFYVFLKWINKVNHVNHTAMQVAADARAAFCAEEFHWPACDIAFRWILLALMVDGQERRFVPVHGIFWGTKNDFAAGHDSLIYPGLFASPWRMKDCSIVGNAGVKWRIFSARISRTVRWKRRGLDEHTMRRRRQGIVDILALTAIPKLLLFILVNLVA